MVDLKEKIKNLPDKPGVYLMKNEKGKIIYIGKAVILKNRVRQYFHSSGHTPKVKAMVSHIRDLEYIVTDSEKEALILECNLIKKHKPRFNIIYKDDKHYPYIKVTMNEEYPRIIKTRRIKRDGAKYFGPYLNVTVINDTIDILRKLFGIRTCKKVLPKDMGKDRPCLNYHIGQCIAPCQGNVNREEYRMLIRDVCHFLGGRQEEIIKKLEKEMRDYSDNLEFEKAIKLRNKIISLKKIAEKQKVFSTSLKDQDVIALYSDNADTCVQVFFVRGGKLIGREHFFLEQNAASEGELLISFLKQFYGSAEGIPGEIVVQGFGLSSEDARELNIIQQWLSEKRELKVDIKIPQRGEKVRMVEMVRQNAKILLEQFRNHKAESKESLEKLGEMAGLNVRPGRIEAYDISNTGTSEITASMVVFEEGKPARSEYRRFKIKSTARQDDYLSMKEVISRRFKHADKNKSSAVKLQTSFNRIPDLILVDGGLGHVNAVKAVLNNNNLDIPVLGMVKDDKHRTKGLVGSVAEDKDNSIYCTAVLRLVSIIQNEAHRFAIEYNKKLRNKRYRKSVLDEIEGIGDKRKKELIRHFGSINKIKTANIHDLENVNGINKKTAVKLYNYFH